jgi:hypothetical protein
MDTYVDLIDWHDAFINHVNDKHGGAGAYVYENFFDVFKQIFDQRFYEKRFAYDFVMNTISPSSSPSFYITITDAHGDYFSDFLGKRIASLSTINRLVGELNTDAMFLKTHIVYASTGYNHLVTTCIHKGLKEIYIIDSDGYDGKTLSPAQRKYTAAINAYIALPLGYSFKGLLAIPKFNFAYCPRGGEQIGLCASFSSYLHYKCIVSAKTLSHAECQVRLAQHAPSFYPRKIAEFVSSFDTIPLPPLAEMIKTYFIDTDRRNEVGDNVRNEYVFLRNFLFLKPIREYANFINKNFEPVYNVSSAYIEFETTLHHFKQ